MSWSVTAAPVAFALVVALGCGGQTAPQPDAAADATVSDVVGDGLSADGQVHDATSDKQWPIVYNVVDGGGDSAECYPDGNVMQACCNGQPCRGFCIGDEDGAIECSCYGIPGGCVGENAVDQSPNVCCSTVRGCEGLYICLPAGH